MSADFWAGVAFCALVGWFHPELFHWLQTGRLGERARSTTGRTAE